jgi:UDP-GlcNAc3NAcA epimerase
MKIITIVGARPQFIKASTVSRAIFNYNRKVKISGDISIPKSCGEINEVIIHTGQHFDDNMSQIFFNELELPKPAANLGIGGGTHGKNTGRMIEAIENVLINECPNLVLVYGDTDSTLAGALSAAKMHFPIAHIEAGLRSFNRKMPEEINRVLTDHISDVLFAPTETAVNNLKSEGIFGDKVVNVGDVMYDAALFYSRKAETHSSILNRLQIKTKEYLLATIHRAENTDDPKRLSVITEALNRLSKELTVVFPVHPRTKNRLNALNTSLNPSVMFIDPIGYLDMVMIEKNALIIATDSGGIQKEAFFYGVPCVTLRTETEWIESIQIGWNRLTNPNDLNSILISIKEAIHSKPICKDKPYGVGNSAEIIVDIISKLAYS